MFEKIAAAVGAVKGLAGDAAEAGVEKCKAQLDELAAAAPALEQLGYRVGEIELEVGIPPRILIHMARESAPSAEAFQAVLANFAGRATVLSVLKLIHLAEWAQAKVPLRGRRYVGLVAELGLPPVVRLRYAPIDSEPAPTVQPKT
jgi:hypothetical protein